MVNTQYCIYMYMLYTMYVTYNKNVDIKFSGTTRLWNNLNLVPQNQKIGNPI